MGMGREDNTELYYAGVLRRKKNESSGREKVNAMDPLGYEGTHRLNTLAQKSHKNTINKYYSIILGRRDSPVFLNLRSYVIGICFFGLVLPKNSRDAKSSRL